MKVMPIHFLYIMTSIKHQHKIIVLVPFIGCCIQSMWKYLGYLIRPGGLTIKLMMIPIKYLPLECCHVWFKFRPAAIADGPTVQTKQTSFHALTALEPYFITYFARLVLCVGALSCLPSRIVSDGSHWYCQEHVQTMPRLNNINKIYIFPFVTSLIRHFLPWQIQLFNTKLQDV